MCCVVPGNWTGALSPVHAALIPGGQAGVGPTLLLGPVRGHSRPVGKGKLTWCPARRSKPFALRARACYPRAGGDPVASGPVRSGHDREQLSRCALALVIPAQAGIHRPRSGWVMYVNSFRAARDFISFDERQKKRSKEKRCPRHSSLASVLPVDIFRLAVVARSKNGAHPCAPPCGCPACTGSFTGVGGQKRRQFPLRLPFRCRCRCR